MTAPRQVLPGTTYLVTRRCAQRQFLLKPSTTGNQVFLFLLAVAARRCAIQVHAFCVLSNHYHLIVTDPEARLPEFHQYLDALVARALNALIGRSESFWAPNSYSAVALVSPSDIVDKTAYVLANPVAARLVSSGRKWPGLWSAPEQVGGATLDVSRPQHFFDSNGSVPETAALELVAPPGFSSAEQFRNLVVEALGEREAQAVRAARGRFLGVRRVLAQSPTTTPSAAEPRRTMKPRIASLDAVKRVEAIGRLVAFLRSYRAAWAARRAGKAGVIFPCGTYLLRVAHGVPCAGFI